MNLPESILTPAESAALRLRSLFFERGYTRYEMSKFEEYELYINNREFFGGDIITFTGAAGKLMALRPDVTLSIVKNTRLPAGETMRLYYHENIYRRSGLSREFKERAQCGVECIGDVGETETGEILALAWESAAIISPHCILDISHVGFISGIFTELKLPPAVEGEILRRICEKNVPELEKLSEKHKIASKHREILLELASVYGHYGDVRGRIGELSVNETTRAALAEMDGAVDFAENVCPDADIRADFSLTQDVNYYNGIVFQGYAEGYASRILSGGRYDGLLRRFGREGGAIGFSVYVDMLGRRGNHD